MEMLSVLLFMLRPKPPLAWGVGGSGSETEACDTDKGQILMFIILVIHYA